MNFHNKRVTEQDIICW